MRENKTTPKGSGVSRHRRRVAVTMAALVGMGTTAAPAIGAGPESWQFEFTPYLFGAGLDGTTGIAGVTAEVGLSFGDMLENLDAGFMSAFEARKGPWLLAADGVYFRLKDQKTGSWQGPGGIGSATGELEASMTQQVYQLAAGYRLLDAGTRLDVIGAGRYTRLDTDLNLVTTTGGLLPGGVRSLSASESWWDPVIGVRVAVPLAEHWTVIGYADVGGFGVGSDVTGQLIAGVNWQFAPSWIAKLGYRYFYQDYKNNGFVWDMTAHGLYAGLGIRF